jgi:hypothetical protein
MIGFLSFFGGVPLKGPIHIIGVERTFCSIWERKNDTLLAIAKRRRPHLLGVLAQSRTRIFDLDSWIVVDNLYSPYMSTAMTSYTHANTYTVLGVLMCDD